MSSVSTVAVLLVVLVFHTKSTTSQGRCSQCDDSACRQVRTCRDNSNTDCSLQYQCVASNLVMGEKGSRCLEGERPVLTKYTFLYTPLSCSADHSLCTGQHLRCHDDICCSAGAAATPAPVSTQAPDPCHPDCRLNCQFGLQHDSSGCTLCVCKPHPCTDVKCRRGEKCTVAQWHCRNGSCYEPQCISDDGQPGGCPAISCNMLCPHGFATDPQTGCPVCQCRSDPGDSSDLCQGPHGLRCPADRHCEMRDVPCFSPPCSKAPVCVMISSENANTPCAQIPCRMFCPHGFARDANDCETCDCNKPTDCSQMSCGPDKECQVQNNQAVCVDLMPKTPCGRIPCRMFCPHGFARDADDCETCDCNIPTDCSQMDCGERKECQITNGQAVCIDKPELPCGRIQCRMFCPHGFARDANNCETCDCMPPTDCSQLSCGAGQECQVVGNKAQCVDKPAGPCGRIQCRMFCPHGFARDANNCEICDCMPPTDCSQIACGVGSACQIVNGKPVCVDEPQTPCGRIQCRMFCPHGFARDANNCETCDCNIPTDCSQMVCGVGQQCQMVNQGPVCVDEPQTPCRRIQCRMFCPHGFARDANNCETCDCNIPTDCSQMVCGVGQQCQMVNVVPVCVDAPQTPCGRIQCRMFCPHGFARDANNCETCDCNIPTDCSQMVCGVGQQCQMVNQGPVCVEILFSDEPQTPCRRIQCRMFCPHGFARDANNCETCDCNIPTDCSQMVCSAGQVCNVVNEEPVCVDMLQKVCARIGCLESCPHGFARDANNCPVCECIKATDCSQLQCGNNAVCVYQKIEGCTTGVCLEPTCFDLSSEKMFLPSTTTTPTSSSSTTTLTTPISEEERRRQRMQCFIQQLMQASRTGASPVLHDCP